MILPPLASPPGFISGLYLPEKEKASWVIFSKDQLLMSLDKKQLPTENGLCLQRSFYLGTYDDRHFMAAEVETGNDAPVGYEWCSLRSLYSVMNEAEYAIAGRAFQLLHWDRTHQFCGSCGHHTSLRTHERCRECKNCGQLFYPKLAPVVMVLIKKGNQILLARGSHFPGKTYSVLAGYVDPGETLEQCVEREVFEEVGIKVKNIQYFNSQPWPFSHSLLIGFTCEWMEGEIQPDPQEIEAVNWFESSNLPELPSKLSLAHMLVVHSITPRN
jgi:NAD+ diphosphatase